MEDLTRRDLLATPFRAANKTTLGNDTESAEPRFVGTVRSVGSDLLTLSVDGRVHSVSLATSADVSRGNQGPLSDLASFEPGDRIVVEGHKIDDGHTAATVVATPFSEIKAMIVGVSAKHDRVMTTSGVFRVDLRERPEADMTLVADDLTTGVRIQGLVWNNGKENVLVLAVLDEHTKHELPAREA